METEDSCLSNVTLSWFPVVFVVLSVSALCLFNVFRFSVIQFERVSVFTSAVFFGKYTTQIFP